MEQCSFSQFCPKVAYLEKDTIFWKYAKITDISRKNAYKKMSVILAFDCITDIEENFKRSFARIDVGTWSLRRSIRKHISFSHIKSRSAEIRAQKWGGYHYGYSHIFRSSTKFSPYFLEVFTDLFFHLTVLYQIIIIKALF